MVIHRPFFLILYRLTQIIYIYVFYFNLIFSVILILRDEDKWIESFRKFFEAEQNDFAEMKWHRLYGHLYRFIFPHTGRPMRVYMDFLRSLKTLFDKYNKDNIFFIFASTINAKHVPFSIRFAKWTKNEENVSTRK